MAVGSIRDMCIDDVQAVLEIERVSFPSPWSEGIFLEEIARIGADRVWVVVESTRGVLGFAGLVIMGEEAHVLDLAVRPDMRRRGLAVALVSHLMDRAVASGAHRLTLEVRKRNVPAHALYRAAGFACAGVRPGYYADTGDDAVIMWTGDLRAEHAVLREDLAVRAREALTVLLEGEDGHPEIILAIETSCDETAAAVLRDGHEVLADVVASQVDFHARFGGVVPEIASRKHIEAIVGVVDEALETAGVGLCDITALAVTHGPGLVGALVVGVAYAKGLAMATGLPLVGVNHLEGHIVANTLTDPTVAPPLVALVVSGGHTSLVYVPAWGEYHVMGQTLDDAAGEAFDKIAKVLGLGYPGGPAISRLAAKGDPTAIDFPRALMGSGDYAFSLSGLKTSVITYIRREEEAERSISVPDVAASFQRAVIDVQVAKTVRAALEMEVGIVCLAGGVAANTELRKALQEALGHEGIRLSVPAVELCTDNAIMIAAAAHLRLSSGPFLPLDAEAVPDLTL